MHEVNILFGKEVNHILKSRGVLWTAFLLPVLFLVAAPAPYLLMLVSFPSVDLPLPRDLPSAPDAPHALLLQLLFPLFVVSCGLLVPSSTATYTLIAEREQRTLELLVGLPVRIGHVLLAKLLVVGMVSSGVCLSLYSLDALLLFRLGIASPVYLLALCAVLLAALAYSTSSALLIALLAPDLRTANNLAAALILPTTVVCTVLLLASPETIGLLVVALLLALAAAAALWIALRVVTFERLLR